MANSKRGKEIFTLVVVFAGVVLISALTVYLIGGARRVTPEAAPAQSPDAVLGMPDGRATPPVAPDSGGRELLSIGCLARNKAAAHI